MKSPLSRTRSNKCYFCEWWKSKIDKRKFVRIIFWLFFKTCKDVISKRLAEKRTAQWKSSRVAVVCFTLKISMYSELSK